LKKEESLPFAWGMNGQETPKNQQGQQVIFSGHGKNFFFLPPTSALIHLSELATQLMFILIQTPACTYSYSFVCLGRLPGVRFVLRSNHLRQDYSQV